MAFGINLNTAGHTLGSFAGNMLGGKNWGQAFDPNRSYWSRLYHLGVGATDLGLTAANFIPGVGEAVDAVRAPWLAADAGRAVKAAAQVSRFAVPSSTAGRIISDTGRSIQNVVKADAANMPNYSTAGNAAYTNNQNAIINSTAYGTLDKQRQGILEQANTLGGFNGLINQLQSQKTPLTAGQTQEVAMIKQMQNDPNLNKVLTDSQKGVASNILPAANYALLDQQAKNAKALNALQPQLDAAAQLQADNTNAMLKRQYTDLVNSLASQTGLARQNQNLTITQNNMGNDLANTGAGAYAANNGMGDSGLVSNQQNYNNLVNLYNNNQARQAFANTQSQNQIAQSDAAANLKVQQEQVSQAAKVAALQRTGQFGYAKTMGISPNLAG